MKSFYENPGRLPIPGPGLGLDNKSNAFAIQNNGQPFSKVLGI